MCTAVRAVVMICVRFKDILPVLTAQAKRSTDTPIIPDQADIENGRVAVMMMAASRIRTVSVWILIRGARIMWASQKHRACVVGQLILRVNTQARGARGLESTQVEMSLIDEKEVRSLW